MNTSTVKVHDDEGAGIPTTSSSKRKKSKDIPLPQTLKRARSLPIGNFDEYLRTEPLPLTNPSCSLSSSLSSSSSTASGFITSTTIRNEIARQTTSPLFSSYPPTKNISYLHHSSISLNIDPLMNTNDDDAMVIGSPTNIIDSSSPEFVHPTDVRLSSSSSGSGSTLPQPSSSLLSQAYRSITHSSFPDKQNSNTSLESTTVQPYPGYFSPPELVYRSDCSNCRNLLTTTTKTTIKTTTTPCFASAVSSASVTTMNPSYPLSLPILSSNGPSSTDDHHNSLFPHLPLSSSFSSIDHVGSNLPPDLACIHKDTLVKLLRGDYDDSIGPYYIIDARYPYEYEGGHIRNAINISTPWSMQQIFFSPPLPVASSTVPAEELCLLSNDDERLVQPPPSFTSPLPSSRPSSIILSPPPLLHDSSSHSCNGTLTIRNENSGNHRQRFRTWSNEKSDNEEEEKNNNVYTPVTPAVFADLPNILVNPSSSSSSDSFPSTYPSVLMSPSSSSSSSSFLRQNLPAPIPRLPSVGNKLLNGGTTTGTIHPPVLQSSTVSLVSPIPLRSVLPSLNHTTYYPYDNDNETIVSSTNTTLHNMNETFMDESSLDISNDDDGQRSLLLPSTDTHNISMYSTVSSSSSTVVSTKEESSSTSAPPVWISSVRSKRSFHPRTPRRLLMDDEADMIVTTPKEIPSSFQGIPHPQLPPSHLSHPIPSIVRNVNVSSSNGISSLSTPPSGCGKCVNKPPIIIFHCEFSVSRGPALMRLFRNYDRQLHQANYPALSYPELYLVYGGYSQFYEPNSPYCEPLHYRPMQDEDFREQCKRDTASTKAAYSAFKSATRGQTLNDILYPSASVSDLPQRSVSLPLSLVPSINVSSLRRKLVNGGGSSSNHNFSRGHYPPPSNDLIHHHENQRSLTVLSEGYGSGSVPLLVRGRSAPSVSMDSVDEEITIDTVGKDDTMQPNSEESMRENVPLYSRTKSSASRSFSLRNRRSVSGINNSVTAFSPTGSMSPLAVAFSLLANDDPPVRMEGTIGPHRLP